MTIRLMVVSCLKMSTGDGCCPFLNDEMCMCDHPLALDHRRESLYQQRDDEPPTWCPLRDDNVLVGIAL